MEGQFEKAIAEGVLPGVVLLAGTADGKFQYSNKFGSLSSAPSRKDVPITEDTVFRLASATKLFTSVAAMQLVERGLLNLDDDVRTTLPALKDIKILKGFQGPDEKEPILEEPSTKITLRHLLSHSTGGAYEALDPLLTQYRTNEGREVISTEPRVTERFVVMLTSEPGSKWMYSPSIDWTGLLIEHVTGQSLEQYMQENIGNPLGFDTMTFFLQKRSDLFAKRSDISLRDKDTGKTVDAPQGYWNEDPLDCFGGLGLFATPISLFKLCQSLLTNDGKVLSKATRDLMFQPQLGDEARESLNTFLSNEFMNGLGIGGSFPAGSKRDYSLCGMVLLEQHPNSPRKAGTVAWMGLPHVHWFIDPTTGLCGVFAAQIEPSDDLQTRRFEALFEKTMYERVASA